jgi:nitroreductase
MVTDSPLRPDRSDPAYTPLVRESKATHGTITESVLRALRKTRQVRQFTSEPVTDSDLHEILEVARWSGSSINRQPWTFIVIRDRAELERLAELAPNAKHVAGAAVAIAIAMSGDNPEWDAYDEGRAAERILVAAGALGLGAAIGWAIEVYRDRVAAFLGLTAPAFVRTIISIGHPTDAARLPRAAPGTARRSINDLVRDRSADTD